MHNAMFTTSGGGGGSRRHDARIGRRIRGKRRAMGLEQGMLARVLGVQVEAIQAYENGTAPVPDQHLRLLADYFGVSVDYFVPRAP